MTEAAKAAQLPGDSPVTARIIAVANQKGGVGKSTTVVNLGAWLALRGSRVLLVDLDPQANATTGVGVDSRTASGNVYRVLAEDLPLSDAVEATSVKNLYVVPSTIDLAGAEIELVSAFSRELKLKKALAEVREDYDFIFIDCPPSLGLLTVNALAAAEEVLVPIQCEFYALEGLGQLLKNVSLVQSSLNPDLRLSGIVLTMFDARTKLAEQVAAEVRAHFPGRVHSSVIPRSVRLSEAPSFGQPVALYDPKSQGSLAYERLAQELEGAPIQQTAESGFERAGSPPTHQPPEPAVIDTRAGSTVPANMADFVADPSPVEDGLSTVSQPPATANVAWPSPPVEQPEEEARIPSDREPGEAGAEKTGPEAKEAEGRPEVRPYPEVLEASQGGSE